MFQASLSKNLIFAGWMFEHVVCTQALYTPLRVYRQPRKTAGVCTCVSVCLRVLEWRWGAWLMLRTCLRDSVSVGLLSPPDTCWDTRLYPIFFPISFLQILSFEAGPFFFSLNCNAIVPAYCNLSFTCWIIAVVIMIPLPPPHGLKQPSVPTGGTVAPYRLSSPSCDMRWINSLDGDCPQCQCPPPLTPLHWPVLPPAQLGLVSVWQALGPVRWPAGCDGQQLRVPLPAVWRPLRSRPGTQPAKVTSLQLSLRKKKKIPTLTYVSYTSALFSNIKNRQLASWQKSIRLSPQNKMDVSCPIPAHL